MIKSIRFKLWLTFFVTLVFGLGSLGAHTVQCQTALSGLRHAQYFGATGAAGTGCDRYLQPVELFIDLYRTARAVGAVEGHHLPAIPQAPKPQQHAVQPQTIRAR